MAAVDTLLEAWREYVASPAYQSEKARAHRYYAQELTPQIVEERRGQQELKQRVHRLRHSFRVMRKHERHLESGRLDAVPAHESHT